MKMYHCFGRNNVHDSDDIPLKPGKQWRRVSRSISCENNTNVVHDHITHQPTCPISVETKRMNDRALMTHFFAKYVTTLYHIVIYKEESLMEYPKPIQNDTFIYEL